MGNCIHFKDGKYRLWSSYTDSFITKWSTKKELFDMLLKVAIEDDKRILEDRFKRAEENGCSLWYEIIRHTKEEL